MGKPFSIGNVLRNHEKECKNACQGNIWLFLHIEKIFIKGNQHGKKGINHINLYATSRILNAYF